MEKGIYMNDLVPQEEKQITPVNEVPESNAMAMIASAVAQGQSPDSLKLLMDLRDREESTQAKKAFVLAMAKFKENAPTITKDHDVAYGNTKYSHATLVNVVSRITESLSQFGLSHNWTTSQADNKVTVTCTITHHLGHSESTSLSAAPDTSGSKNPIQALGSAVTYLQRYTILAITGLAAGGTDDDGMGAHGHGAGQPKDEREFYPQDKWEANFPNWSAAICSGAKSKEGLISYIESKHILSDKQRADVDALIIQPQQ